VNETLCRALLRARLTEEDVAARLQVDPKTVRRWLEGRLPYLRHRWAIAAMLGADEADLWPQLRAARARPDEVVAIYPHRDAVPRDVWLRVLGSAQRDIGILDDTGPSPISARPVVATLADRAQSGVRVRICLRGSDPPEVQRALGPGTSNTPRVGVDDALDLYAPLRDNTHVEVRLTHGTMYSSICRSDDQLLVSQHAYGVGNGQASVLHLRRAEEGDMVKTYLDAFEQTWADARPAE